MRRVRDRVLYVWPFGDWSGKRHQWPEPPAGYAYDRPRFRPGAWRYLVLAGLLVLAFVVVGTLVTALLG